MILHLSEMILAKAIQVSAGFFRHAHLDHALHQAH